jgi:hypothetical protein
MQPRPMLLIFVFDWPSPMYFIVFAFRSVRCHPDHNRCVGIVNK